MTMMKRKAESKTDAPPAAAGSLRKAGGGGASNLKPKYEKPKFVAPDIDSIEIEIEDVASVEYHRSYAIYGRAGSGKTTLLGTFPGPVLLLDMSDEGTDSVADVPGLKVIRIRSWPMVEAVYWDIKNNPAKYAAFQTIGLDTVTKMQNMCLAYYLESKGRDPKEAGQWGSMKKSDWGAVSGQMKEWITSYRDLPVHTVFIAQDKEAYRDEDDDAERRVDEEYDVLPEIGPSLMKSVQKDMCAAVHVIGYTFLRERPNPEGKEVKAKDRYQYCLRVGPHPVFSTKVRKPITVTVPELLINPTFDDIIDIVKGDK